MDISDRQRTKLQAWIKASEDFVGVHKKKSPSFYALAMKTVDAYSTMELDHFLDRTKPKASDNAYAEPRCEALEMAISMARTAACISGMKNYTNSSTTVFLDKILLSRMNDESGRLFTSLPVLCFEVVAEAVVKRCEEAGLSPVVSPNSERTVVEVLNESIWQRRREIFRKPTL